MKTFAEFLNEMALKSYRYEFGAGSDREEGFYADASGRKDLGNQVYRIKGNPGETRDITKWFSLKDRKIITHPRTARILEEKLKNSEFDFNILLIEDKTRGAELGSPRKGNYYYEDHVEDFMRENGMRKEGHITFVKNSTSGHVLTPWMILHTLGHALAEEDAVAERRIKDIINMMYPSTDNLPETLAQIKKRMEALGSVFSFASASIEGEYNSSNNPPELVHELVAEFLWNGDKIRIRTPHDKNPEVIRQVGFIEREIRLLLQKSVGNIIYDYYIG